MQIELENNSAPSIKDFVERNNILGVGFDLDSTLIDTSNYFNEGLLSAGRIVAKTMEKEDMAEDIASEILSIARKIYAENNKPMLIQEFSLEAISMYISKEFASEIREEIERNLEYFYINSPEPYSRTKDVVGIINSLGLPIVIHSHAQQDWTEIKIHRLKEDIGFVLPYLATDINGEKDSESWKKAAQLVEVDISDMLVVGDNLRSDIIPALEAGCKHVVWLNHFGRELPEELKGRVHVISKIEDLLYL